MSGQGGNRQVVADEMFPDGPGSFLDFADTDEGVSSSGRHYFWTGFGFLQESALKMADFGF